MIKSFQPGLLPRILVSGQHEQTHFTQTKTYLINIGFIFKTTQIGFAKKVLLTINSGVECTREPVRDSLTVLKQLPLEGTMKIQGFLWASQGRPN